MRLVHLLAFLTAFAAAEARACPNCPTSKAVRALVCSDHPWRNAAAVLAPFPLFLVAAFAVPRLFGRRIQ